MYYKSAYVSPLGKMLMTSDGESLTGLWFEGQRHFAAGLSQEGKEMDLPVFEQTKKWLDVYFSGGKPDNAPPLSPLNATPFRLAVWEILRLIPRGQTVTYKQVAERCRARTGKKTSARAVGGAVGRNPLALLIPCHRVTGTGGALTGYAAGLDKKAALLRLEGAL